MKALIIVDAQKDFAPGGTLAVPYGDQIVEIANKLMKDWDGLIFATKDWHPEDHVSFADNHPGKKVLDIIEASGVTQMLWPRHCVQNSPGSEFIDGLNQEKISSIIVKGTDPKIDSYSTFYDNGRKKDTGLRDILKDLDVTEVYILGLATEYCVKFSALDAVEDFKTYIVSDGCRGLNPEDVKKAYDEMVGKGIRIITSDDI